MDYRSPYLVVIIGCHIAHSDDQSHDVQHARMNTGNGHMSRAENV